MFNAFMAALMLQATGTAAADACMSVAKPPPALGGWATPRRVDAGSTVANARSLRLGGAIIARLPSSRDVRYAVRPERPGGSDSHGGLLVFTVTDPGRYRIALGAGAWIDVVNGQSAVASAAHGRGPACTGIRKMVDFDLAPGRYILQLSGNRDANLQLLVAKLPAQPGERRAP